MFFVIFKRGQDAEKSKLVFEKPLTFSTANDILASESERVGQTGKEAKIPFKIMDAETGENVFNSKIQLNKHTLNFFETIKSNSNVPEKVALYIQKIEKKEIVETDEHLNDINDSEALSNLESLKNEKKRLEEALNNQEKISAERELEFKRNMDKLEAEKASLEKIMSAKKKEENDKNSLRIARLKELEEEAKKSAERMNEQRAVEKKSKEEYEKSLEENEKAVEKAKIELSNVVAEYEKKQIERAKEIQALEEEAKKAEREAQILKAQMEKQKLEHELQKNQLESKINQEAQEEKDITEYKPPLEQKTKKDELIKEKDLQNASNPKHFEVLSKPATNLKRQKVNEKQDIDELLKLERVKLLKELREDREEEKRKQEKKEKMAVKKAKSEVKAMEAYKKRRIGSFRSSRSKFGLFVILLLGAACVYFMGIDLPGVAKELRHHIKDFQSYVFQK
ncbi:hypothetical protein ACDX77_19265 [Bacillus velezensis]|uniref:hypothetical protein n=1 Tax=Bacillus velezensis TaxID=492670 RepID=UPI003555E29A